MKRILLLALLPVLFSPPAQAGFTDRTEVRNFVIDMQQRNGIDSAVLLQLFHEAQSLPEVLKAIRPAADPAVRSWAAYRSRFIEAQRIAAGLVFWQQNGAALARAETRYGVPAEIIVSIIGIETHYGRLTGNYPTFSALATLAFDYPPRAALFRRELEALLLLARDENRHPLDYRSSYAGALGLPQFLPSSLRRWAIDFDGNGKVDLANPTDAIGSVGNFLFAHGWIKDGPILSPAAMDEKNPDAAAGIAQLIAEGITPRRQPDEMLPLGISAPDALPLPAALIDYVTPDATTEYRLGYNNFFVITRYNRSSFYATAVNDLADAIKAAMQQAQTLAP
jgi:membrane-bound lytic murein transglycosylase B